MPTFALVMGGTTMGTVLVPTLARLRVASPERVPVFLGSALTGSAGIALALGATFATASPFLLPAVTHFEPATRVLATQFCWALVPFLGSVAVSAVCRAACEVHGYFAAPALAPMVRASLSLGCVWALRPIGPMALPLGVLAGNLGEVTVLVATLRFAGIRVAWPSTAVPELRAALHAFGPVLIGETMVALSVIVDKMFAGLLDEGSVSLLEYADRARMIPQTLLESTLMVVAFNAWAAARARGDEAGRHRAVATTLWWVALLAPPVLAGMSIGRIALVRFLYEGGAFDGRHVATTAATLGGYLPGVFFSLLGALVVKAHIVEGRYGLVMRLGILSFSLNVVLDAALMPLFGLVGLALATTITTAVATAVSFACLVPSLRGTLPARDLRDAALAALACAGLALLARVTHFAPEIVTDSALWIAALPFCGVLAIGVRRARAAAAS